MVPVDAVCMVWLSAASLQQVLDQGAAQNANADTLASFHFGEDTSLAFALTFSTSRVRDVIDTRWRQIIENVLAEIIGQPVILSIVSEVDEATPMHEKSDVPEPNNASFPAARSSTGNYAYYEIPPPARAEARESYSGH